MEMTQDLHILKRFLTEEELTKAVKMHLKYRKLSCFNRLNLFYPYRYLLVVEFDNHQQRSVILTKKERDVLKERIIVFNDQLKKYA